jgi:hypothetical protein
MPQWAIFGLAGAAAVAASVFMNSLENKRIREETRAIVEAEALNTTMETINNVRDTAERARLKRRACAANGLRYNPASGECE